MTDMVAVHCAPDSDSSDDLAVIGRPPVSERAPCWASRVAAGPIDSSTQSRSGGCLTRVDA